MFVSSAPLLLHAARIGALALTLQIPMVMGVAMLCVSPAALAQEKGKAKSSSAEEDRIWNEVRMTLAVHPDVRGAALQVEIEDGKVTLSGQVRDEKARRKAEELTRKVKGVKEVVSKLTLMGEQ